MTRPVQILNRHPNLQPVPQNVTFYSGPSIPVVYDENWQFFTNLTPEQVAWFQSQPEWQNFLSYVAASPDKASAGTPIAVVNSVLATNSIK